MALLLFIEKSLSRAIVPVLVLGTIDHFDGCIIIIVINYQRRRSSIIAGGGRRGCDRSCSYAIVGTDGSFRYAVLVDVIIIIIIAKHPMPMPMPHAHACAAYFEVY